MCPLHALTVQGPVDVKVRNASCDRQHWCLGRQSVRNASPCGLANFSPSWAQSQPNVSYYTHQAAAHVDWSWRVKFGVRCPVCSLVIGHLDTRSSFWTVFCPLLLGAIIPAILSLSVFVPHVNFQCRELSTRYMGNLLRHSCVGVAILPCDFCARPDRTPGST